MDFSPAHKGAETDSRSMNRGHGPYPSPRRSNPNPGRSRNRPPEKPITRASASDGTEENGSREPDSLAPESAGADPDVRLDSEGDAEERTPGPSPSLPVENPFVAVCLTKGCTVFLSSAKFRDRAPTRHRWSVTTPHPIARYLLPRHEEISTTLGKTDTAVFVIVLDPGP